MGFILKRSNGSLLSLITGINCKHFVVYVNKHGNEDLKCVSKTTFLGCRNCGLKNPKLNILNNGIVTDVKP